MSKERLGSLKRAILTDFLYLERAINRADTGYGYRHEGDEYNADIEYLTSFENDRHNLKIDKDSDGPDFQDTESGSVRDYVLYQQLFNRVVDKHYRFGKGKRSILVKRAAFSRVVRNMEKQGLLKLKFATRFTKASKHSQYRVSAVKITSKAYLLIDKLRNNINP